MSKRWRAIHDDPDTWQPHLDRLKDEAGKIAAAVERFDQLSSYDPAWAHVFEMRLTMAELQKDASTIVFYLQGWEELVEEAGALDQREGLPDQARNMVERVLEYDNRCSAARATVNGFFEDAEEHGQRWDALEEDAKRRDPQDPDFLVTDFPGYRSLPDFPKKLLTTGRAIYKDEDAYAPHLDRITDGRQELAAALERIERHRLLDRFVSVMDRIEETKPSAVTQGISPVGDEGYDQAIDEAARLAREPDLEEAARRRLQAEIDEHASPTGGIVSWSVSAGLHSSNKPSFGHGSTGRAWTGIGCDPAQARLLRLAAGRSSGPVPLVPVRRQEAEQGRDGGGGRALRRGVRLRRSCQRTGRPGDADQQTHSTHDHVADPCLRRRPRPGRPLRGRALRVHGLGRDPPPARCQGQRQ